MRPMAAAPAAWAGRGHTVSWVSGQATPWPGRGLVWTPQESTGLRSLCVGLLWGWAGPPKVARIRLVPGAVPRAPPVFCGRRLTCWLCPQPALLVTTVPPAVWSALAKTMALVSPPRAPATAAPASTARPASTVSPGVGTPAPVAAPPTWEVGTNVGFHSDGHCSCPSPWRPVRQGLAPLTLGRQGWRPPPRVPCEQVHLSPKPQL